jgi:competence protein ComEC
MAILLGEKSSMDAEVRTAFSRSGLSHLMAVSGMHVGFVLMPVWLIIPWFWTHRLGRSAGLMLIALILFFYAGLTGFTASVSRASITACLLAIGKLFQRNRDSLNTTGVAAYIILCVEPASLFDIGFQLSFMAVSVILILGPVLRDTIPSYMRFSWKGTLMQFLGISIMVQLGLFPLLAVKFGEFSVAGALCNRAGVPITQLLFLWSMIGLPLAAISDWFQSWIMIPPEWLAQALIFIAETVGNQEYSWISVREMPPMLPVVWLTGIGVLAAVYTQEIRFRWLGGLLFLLCLMRIGALWETRTPAVLEVVVYDVGQGDALLLRTPSGRHILYDTGVLSPFQNSGRSVILPDLQARGVRKLDAVILSHPHADHIGGIHSILQEMPVDVIYQAPLSYRSAIFAGYMALAREKGVPIVEVIAGSEISPDPAMRMLVMHPAPEVVSSDPNAHSVAIKVVFGQTGFLLTGDAESVAESMMVARYDSLLQSNWLKAGHHGSKTSSGELFLSRVRPEHVAVSLALSNRYRHPHREAIVRIQDGGPQVRFTSLHKALVYESDGEQIRQIMWEAARRQPP